MDVTRAPGQITGSVDDPLLQFKGLILASWSFCFFVILTSASLRERRKDAIAEIHMIVSYSI